MNQELDAYDNLMGTFSYAIDQAMRKTMDGQPEPMRTSAIITVFASYLLGSLNECQSNEVRQEWIKIVTHNLRGLPPPED